MSEHHPDIPAIWAIEAEQSAQTERRYQHMTRRLALKIGVGVTATASLGGATSELLYRRELYAYKDTTPKLHYIDNAYNEESRLVLYFPGFQETLSRALYNASLLRSHADLSDGAAVAVVDQSDRGATTDQLAELLKNTVNSERTRLDTFQRSMAGPVGELVLAKAGIPVMRSSFISSPDGPQHVYEHVFAQALGTMPSDVVLHLSPILDIAGTSYHHHQLNGGFHPLNDLRFGVHQMTNPNSTSSLADAQFLLNLHEAAFSTAGSDYITASQRIHKPGHSPLYYAQPSNPQTDNVVNIPASKPAIMLHCARTQNAFIEVNCNYTGHASPAPSFNGLAAAQTT